MPTNSQKKRTSQQPKLGLNEDESTNSAAGDGLPEYLKIAKTIRIAVSGDVLLTKLETEIIDTIDFQRLRGIRQLGTVNTVYPTALHTRFDHSLGTLAMADRMIRAIRNNTHSTPEEQYIDHMQVALTRLYALLHDLPHVPFGHTIEDELSIFTRHDKNPARISRFFGETSQVGKLIIDHLGQEAYQRFIAIYTWDENNETPLENDDNFVYDIVSNTVCADLLDYLARDSYFCNLEIPLDYRFLNFIYLGRDAKDLKRVFVRLWKKDKHQPRRDTLTGLAGLLEARYLVAERAYFHHAKIISGAMLGRALQESHLSGEISEEDLYALGDDTLLLRLSQSKNPICSRLAKDLINRHLYKGLRKFTKADFDATQEQDHDQNALNTAYLRLSDPNSRKSLEDQLAAEIGTAAGNVILYSPDKKMNLKAAKMKVLWQGNPKSLSQIDDKIIAPKLKVILDAHQMLWGIHVICSTELSERQKELLSTACEIEFLCNADKKGAKQHKYYEDLIELHLVDKNMETLFSSAEFLTRRSEAASALIATANDNRSWAKRIDDVVVQFFSQEKRPE
jgi:HD superfamily phosphohydrolase